MEVRASVEALAGTKSKILAELLKILFACWISDKAILTSLKLQMANFPAAAGLGCGRRKFQMLRWAGIFGYKCG